MCRLTRPEWSVLDYGCGEALYADEVAAASGHLTVCDGAETVRAKLLARFGSNPRIAIASPEEIVAGPPEPFDLIIVNSVLQYIRRDDLPALLDSWHAALGTGGKLILADIVSPEGGAVGDALALLRFGFGGGFLVAAVKGLARTALSDYRRLRTDLGLSTYGESEMLALLTEHGFVATRLAQNIGHNDGRMAFEGLKLD